MATLSQHPRSIAASDWGLLVLLSVLWGGAFFFAGVAVRELPPLTVVLVRVVLAAAMLLPVFLLAGHRLPASLRDWRPFLVMGLLNNVLPFGLLFAGQTYVTVGLASILNATTPLFTVVVMAGFGEERLSAQRVAGVVLGLAGVAILQEVDPLSGDGQALGIGLCLAGALSYGLAALWGRRTLAAVAPLKSATCQLICSSAIMVPLAAAVDRPWNLDAPSLEAWGAMAGLALFGTAIAYIVFFRILVRAGASNVMLVTLLIPVTALFLGAAFLDETLRAREIAGALVIGAALLVIDGRIFRVGRVAR